MQIAPFLLQSQNFLSTMRVHYVPHYRSRRLQRHLLIEPKQLILSMIVFFFMRIILSTKSSRYVLSFLDVSCFICGILSVIRSDYLR